MNRDIQHHPTVYLRPPRPKRWAVLAMLYLLAGMLAWIAVFHPPASLGLVIFLWGFVLCALLLANAAAKATAQGLQLRDGAIYSDDGNLLVRIEDVRRVEQSAFAFKPSNGFLLRLKTPQKRGWAPGLWWRTGRSMGVGGATRRAEARVMADTISALVSS